MDRAAENLKLGSTFHFTVYAWLERPRLTPCESGEIIQQLPLYADGKSEKWASRVQVNEIGDLRAVSRLRNLARKNRPMIWRCLGV